MRFMNQNKEKIEAILSKHKEPSFDEIMLCAEQIKKDGNIFFIGLDKIGFSDEKQYIVQISYPNNTEKDDIKANSSSLKEACLSVLKQYFF